MRAFGLLLVAACAATSASTANATTARVGNTYYEDITGRTDCYSAVSCRTVSSITPADAYVRIQHTYCAVQTGNNGIVYRLQLQVWNGPPNVGNSSRLKSVNLTIPSPIVVGISNIISTHEQVSLLVGAGRYVVFEVSSGTTGTVMIECSFTGDLVPRE